MNSPSTTPNTYTHRNEPKWSKSEKAIARKVFDAALKRELQEVMKQVKQKANQISEPLEMWNLERYLAERRKEIDRKYDFRISHMTRVFGMLLHERRISEQELHGLGEDKVNTIRSCAKFLSKEIA